MHPEFLSMALFWIVAAYTPGPNNVVASYSGFNFGIRKTIPHIFGVTFGFTSVVFALTIGLVNVFKLFPIIQTVLKYLGSLFLIYLAYKISFSKASSEKKNENPISFLDTFIFQFLNPKGVLIGIIIVSTYVNMEKITLIMRLRLFYLPSLFHYRALPFGRLWANTLENLRQMRNLLNTLIMLCQCFFF